MYQGKGNMTSDSAIGKIIVILAPHLAKTLTVMENPIPEIYQVLKELEQGKH
jgi:hypothetical protein